MSDIHEELIRVPHGDPGRYCYDVTVHRLQIQTGIETKVRYSFASRLHRDVKLAEWNRDSRWKYWSSP
jgi:hypothetical protein